MDVMRETPDKAYDLAICDPPYGIGRDGGETGTDWKWYAPKEWDSKRPDAAYFAELRRVSKNQIIWGANYMTEHLPPSMGWVVWDKGQDLTMSDCELAYTSFKRALRRKVINRCKIGDEGGRIHPTQKPVALYKWLLNKYTEKGWRILDTHMGSGSSVIAALDLGYEILACEIDADYFAAAAERIERHLQQGTLALT
jgi:site-specific DNA-methyltransferase (adenine-specific)